MAEYVAVAAQDVAANGNVVYTNTAVKGTACVQHREGSGIVTLRGMTNQCKARYFVAFSANIAVPTGGTAEAISLAIAIGGEPVLSSQMISTPAVVEACAAWVLRKHCGGEHQHAGYNRSKHKSCGNTGSIRRWDDERY